MTSEPKRCHVCGRIYPCETCGGTGYRRDERQCYWDPCPDCEDGWREAEPIHAGAFQVLRGTDAAVLCPKCKEAKL